MQNDEWKKPPNPKPSMNTLLEFFASQHAPVLCAALMGLTVLALLVGAIRRDAEETAARRNAARWRKHERDRRRLSGR